ncbi:Apolipoprotein N-acyltransferase [Sphingomonas sp. S2M10]|uniref:apolipoprotein N-acyltransferase n=1 Tax=Sphingomonas sp. S2M10 TaxID=2705010 RepID=UPI0014568232|nr:apolipoprotein N-acyltransferase [Sphingomonas sp. S2M10]NLS28889.1 Apolipoprotein N-acyltransferase [Sphingomonas sp. S2M10]
MFRRPLLASLLLGIASATGFAPLEWWPLTLLCFAGLFALSHAAPTLRSAVLRAWLFGLGHFTLGDNWIQHAFDFQDKMPPALGYAAVVLLALYLAAYPALAMGAAWAFARKVKPRSGWVEPDLGYVLAGAAAWIVTEWLRGVAFTGYPWNPLGVIWVPVPGVRNLATLIGTYALSGVTIAVAGSLYLAFQRQYRPLLVAVVALLALNIAWSDRCDRIRCISTASGKEVVIVQPNIGQDAVGRPDYAEYLLNRMIALTGRPGALPRLVVWPEGMVDYFVEDGYPVQWYRQDPRMVRARIGAVLGPWDRALIGGNALEFGRDNQLQGAGNSVWALGPDGMLGGRYDKAHLVPYGEYLPMRTLLAPLGLARLVMGDVDFLPGPGPRAIAVPGFGNAGIQICYEIIFSGQVVDQAHRPDFLFNPSNDAWFGSWGPPQHLAQARLRAIEEGLPILRSTPTGISALIDGHGRLLGTIPPGEAGAIRLPLPRPLPPTLFAQVGNWMVLLVAALTGLFAIANRRFAR